MKIGILTFHASHNFGSMLQNYALQQFLIAEGHTVETINLRNEKQRYMYSHPLNRGKKTPSILSVLKQFIDPIWLMTECKSWNLFEKFLKKNLYLTNEFKNWYEIKKTLPELKYDAIIVGGDQIWNTFCYDFDWSYFLPTKIKPIRKIAFSPSIGNEIQRTQKDPFRVAKIKEYLEDFDFLSIREKDGADYIKGLTNRSIPVVADPTILADPSIYLDFIKKPIIKEPYIYYYTPSHIPDLEAEKISIELANKLNVKIISSYPRFRQKNRMKSIPTGPEEFLNLVSNAQLVVGKSYHLIIFAILFHKKFITIKSNKDSRLSSLLYQLGIQNRNIDSVDDYKNLSEINYNVADEALERFRNDAITYLRKALY